MTPYPVPPNATRHGPARRAFTLIELLAVIAIIVLLISILVPTVGRARDQAKNARTRTTLKAIGDGLEMFKGENEDEVRKTGGYPPSAAADDPTESGRQHIFGAQWLVRYLVGKDSLGYVARRNVPPPLLENPQQYWEQRYWYATEGGPAGVTLPLPRVGPYVAPEGLSLALPEKLRGAPSSPPVDCDANTLKQPVALDTFGYPILYYAANARAAANADAKIARYRNDPPVQAIYTMEDNGLFTGMCGGGTCLMPPWDFPGVLGGEADDLDNPVHRLSHFGTGTHTADAQTLAAEIAAGKTATFPYYILNKSVFENTNRKTAIPYRKDSFLLITAGKDGIYGTSDDVTNF